MCLTLTRPQQSYFRLFSGCENIRRLIGDAKDYACAGAEVCEAEDAGGVEPQA